MCGFVALLEHQRQFDAGLLQAMGEDIAHRGPDAHGVLRAPGCALVFRRLSILDPTAHSDQPMSDPSGRYTIVFNGEIYNYRELRDELRSAGMTFHSEGDTEVILQGFMHWGEAVLDRLEGMYAFLIWDRQAGVALAARDPFGIKPLYVTRAGPLVGFASEMRPLRRVAGNEPDPAALAELLMFRFAAGRLSNLKGIEQLPGGTLARVDLDSGNYRERRFCDVLDLLRPDPGMAREQALELAAEALQRSVELHLRSDVGYAVQLSGGVDSSLVTALAANLRPGTLRTYGVRLREARHDEGPYRRMFTQRYPVEHREIELTGADFADALPRAVRHMEGPSAHFGCVMLMLLCDRIRETDKVVLTGEGADELFGGYTRYRNWRRLRRYGLIARAVPDALWPRLHRYRALQRYAHHDPAVVSSVYFDFLQMHETFPALVPGPGAREAAAARFRDFRSRMLAVDQSSYLASLLMRQDKMAMAASVEARVPFTHLPLARVLNRIPHRLRVPGGDNKPLLKTLAERWLPGELIHRRKVGLTLPLEDWLRDPQGLGRYLELLEDPNSRLAAYAERPRLEALVRKFRRGTTRSSGVPPVAHLVNMELWLRSLAPESG